MAEQSTKKSSSQVPTDPIDQHSALIGCERKMQGCVSWKTIFLSAIPILEKEGGEESSNLNKMIKWIEPMEPSQVVRQGHGEKRGTRMRVRIPSLGKSARSNR